MSILAKLATSLGRRDEMPNQLLAESVARTKDRAAVRELVANLENESKNIQSDCIKVLYEIGERDPKLIAQHWKALGQLLSSKNNRLVWGAMIALDSIALEKPKEIHGLLAVIHATAQRGSVITNDHAIGIYIKLGSRKPYAKKCLPLVVEQLETCPNNQFAMYAEKTLTMADDKNAKVLSVVVEARRSSLPKESQKKRVDKVLKKLAALA